MGHTDPFSQASDSSLNTMLSIFGSGGRGIPRNSIVMKPQTSRMTTITVVTFIMDRALALDSSMPIRFSHQKLIKDSIAVVVTITRVCLSLPDVCIW